jgi:hypothetical protein
MMIVEMLVFSLVSALLVSLAGLALGRGLGIFYENVNNLDDVDWSFGGMVIGGIAGYFLPSVALLLSQARSVARGA